VLDVSGEASRDAPPHVRLRVTSRDREAVLAVTPELGFQHRVITGDAADLAPGASHEWLLPLPALPGPGTFPVVARVRWAAPGGAAGTVPFVTSVASPDAAPGTVRAALDVPDITGSAGGTLTLANDGPTDVGGRVAFVLPAGLRTMPETEPAVVPAGGRIAVPLVVEAIGAPADAGYPLWAVLEYERDGVHHTTIATVRTRVAAGGWSRRARPLAIGGLMLVLTGGVLAVALRAAARRAAREPSRG